MKALALIALSLALEAGFLFTVAVPAGELAAAAPGARNARVVLVGSQAAPAPPAPRRS